MNSTGYLSWHTPEDARRFADFRAISPQMISSKIEQLEKEIAPGMQTFAVDELKKHLRNFAPEWMTELENMDSALDIPAGSMLKFLSYVLLVQQEKLDCTSWIVTPELSASRKMLLHKNRDSNFSLHAPLFFHTPGKFSWMGSCSQLTPFPLMGINEKGLAVAMNSGEKCEKWNPSGFGTPMMARMVLENCSTPDEAAEVIEELRKAGAYSHNVRGSIFFYANAEYAGVTELCAERSKYIDFDFGYMIRANIWHLPGMTGMSKQSSQFNMDYNTIREYMVRDELNSCIEKGGISPACCIAITRDRGRLLPAHQVPVCRPKTIASGVFEIDGSFPALSSFYHLSGPARNTVVLPLFAGGAALPQELVSGAWTQRAWEFKNRRGMDHVLLPAIEEVEKELFKRHAELEPRLRELLQADQASEALRVMGEHNIAQFELASRKFREITGF